MPLQSPVAPQVVAPWSLHVPVGSTPPAAIGEQVPAVPVSAQDRQLAVQVVAQQTPCAQMPLAQSVPAMHAAPSGFLPQLPPVQTFPAEQSAFVLQVALQLPPPQT